MSTQDPIEYVRKEFDVIEDFILESFERSSVSVYSFSRSNGPNKHNFGT